MADMSVKNFDSPDETRPFEDKGEMRIVNVGDETVGRGTFEPGWRWEENVKPIAGTDSCQTYHLGYVLSGRMRLVLGDHDLVLRPGEAAEFDTRVPHWFGSTGDHPAEILSLFGPQGERVHARARSVAAGTART